MRVDKAATKAARERHAAGVARLNEAFRYTDAIAKAARGDWSRLTPVRTRANTPPVRDPWHAARHRRDKAARAARKRNRRAKR